MQRAKPSGRHDDALPSTADLLASDDVPQVEVKLVPFFGPRGELMGGRVTGVRPGSRLKVAGLEPGDVVVGVDGGFVSSVDHLRMQLRANENVREISILRGTEGPKRSLALGG